MHAIHVAYFLYALDQLHDAENCHPHPRITVECFSIPFFLAAILALVNTLLAYYFMRETLKKNAGGLRSQFNLQALKSVIKQPSVLRISLILLLIQISWSTYYQFIPPILKTLYGFGPHQLGWFLGMIAFWLALATGVGIKLLDGALTVRQLLLLSAYLVLAGLIITLFGCCYTFPHHLWAIWAGAIPTATGDVIAYSCLAALYSNVVAHEKQGKVMGVNFIVVASAWAGTGFLGGLLMSLSPLLPLFIAPAGIIASIVLIHTDFGKRLASEELETVESA